MRQMFLAACFILCGAIGVIDVHAKTARDPDYVHPGTVTARGANPLESWILHHGHYQIELLANLDRVPEAGSLVIVAFPKLRAGRANYSGR